MKKILFIINVDWFFISHFLPVAKKALQEGYEVHLACGFTDKQAMLEDLGIKIHPLKISRSGTTVTHEIALIKEIYTVLKTVRPDIVEFFTIKPLLYGGIVSHFTKVKRKVFYITGLGYIFTKKGLKGSLIKTVVKFLYRFALWGKDVAVITENIYDKQLIQDLNVLRDKNLHILKGAGVDLSNYKYLQEPKQKPLQIAMASRLLRDKGVFEFIAAAKEILNDGYDAEFILYGDIDIYNPASLTVEEVKRIEQENYVKVFGFCSDISKAFQKANIVVLPSYREGLPKVLIEAAACGRAVVTTDVPGCKDAIIPNKTGLLCQVKDAHSLALAIKKLLDDPARRDAMAREGRLLAEREFDINKILQQHFSVYGENK